MDPRELRVDGSRTPDAWRRRVRARHSQVKVRGAGIELCLPRGDGAHLASTMPARPSAQASTHVAFRVSQEAERRTEAASGSPLLRGERSALAREQLHAHPSLRLRLTALPAPRARRRPSTTKRRGADVYDGDTAAAPSRRHLDRRRHRGRDRQSDDGRAVGTGRRTGGRDCDGGGVADSRRYGTKSVLLSEGRCFAAARDGSAPWAARLILVWALVLASNSERESRLWLALSRSILRP